MKRIISLVMIVIFALFMSCTKKESTAKTENELGSESHSIVAQGWGATEEKALEDAKNDALRQYGFRVIEKEGEPQLIPAGKILDFKILSSSSEELENSEKWWDVEIQAELTNI